MNTLVQLTVDRDRLKDGQRRATTTTRHKSIVPATSISAPLIRERMLSIWTHHEPDRLYMVPMDKGDPHEQVNDFLEMHYRANQRSYSLALLVSGTEYPIPVMKHNMDLDYGILLCLPLLNVQVHIQLPSGSIFKESINPMNSILDLKESINKSMGYPVEYQDILFNAHALGNHTLIMDHKIKTAAKLHLFLQPSKPFSVHVKTFWGSTYMVEATACMTVGQLLQAVLQKTFSSSFSELKERMFQYKSMYSHLLMVEYNMTILDNNTCLNQHNIKGGSTLQVMSISESRKDNVKNLEIKTHTGMAWSLKAAVYDTWFIVALRLHAKCTVSLDRMVLTLNNNVINMQCTIGALRHNNTLEIWLEVVEEAASIAGADAIMLNIKLPSGINESLTCSFKDQVKDVKSRLQMTGYKDVMYHDLYLKKVKMPPQSRLSDYKLQNNAQLELKLTEFPIYISHGPNAFAIPASTKWTVQELIAKITEKSSLVTDKCQLLYKGEAVNRVRPDLVSLDRIGATVHSKIFIESAVEVHTVQLLTDTDITTVKSNLESHETQPFEKLCQSPAALIINLKWFFKWRYPQSGKTLGVLDHRNTRRTFKELSKPVLQILGQAENKGAEKTIYPVGNDLNTETVCTPPDDVSSRFTVSTDSDSQRLEGVSSNTSSLDGGSNSLLPSIGKSSLKGSDTDGSRRKHMTVRFELPDKPDRRVSRSRGMLTNGLTTDYFITDSPKFGPLASRSDRHCVSAVDITRIKLGSVMPNYAHYNDQSVKPASRKKRPAPSFVKYQQSLLNYPLPFSGKNIAIRGQCSILKYQRTKKQTENLEALNRSKSDIGYTRVMQSSTK
ncbi:hypothetical protein CAPTEDRAFT_200566 [Capitella teleta]|uniref:Ubiquitin-like domain-containing protein n=1 Tax=Capitella teleta TaxID=283909 RepID=R7T8C5_CAPTE|nr:hypothetical protein CAPTEDRAFT_200566 [Capitella teleta]|eukprot:ELT89875.1 hypothetical protein CAPTEDRAFT_200566 [Capitella teleta]